MVLGYRVCIIPSYGYSTEVMISGIIRPPGQIKLKQSSVIVVGAGGLGCPALQYLAAAGVGEHNALSSCVSDLVILSNRVSRGGGPGRGRIVKSAETNSPY